MTTYISSSQAKSLTKLVVTCFVIMLCVVVVGILQGYNGRVDLVDSQRSGCERGKLDREANAEGWRTAQTARLRTLSETLDISFRDVQGLMRLKAKKGDLPDLTAARKYRKIAIELERRSKINCTKAFPDANLLF